MIRPYALSLKARRAGAAARMIPLLAVMVILAGCGNLAWPPKSGGPGMVRGPAKSVTPVNINEAVERPANNIVTVRAADTLFKVSQRYGVSARGLIKANNLQPPYRLRPGMRLVLPEPKLHRIVRGDTLFGIANTYKVNAFELARLNRLSPPYRIYIGQNLSLPDSAGKPIQLAAFKRPDADMGSVPVEDLPPDPDTSSEPQPAPAQLNEQAAEPEPVMTDARSGSPGFLPRPGIKPDRTARVASLPPRPAKPTRALPPVRKGSAFVWPVKGRLLSGYGAKGDGLHNDGVNILAKRGAPVRAARNGVVAYAGNELRGFGNLLLIKHANGWVTAYAHNETLLVERGEKVSRGQVIARVGETGNVSAPQLHFEIRKGNKAIDPVRQISGRAKRRTAKRRSASKG